MWYLAEVLFAQAPDSDRHDDQCEASNVVFEATEARVAYQKAVAWGLAYAAEEPATMRLLGVSHLTSVGQTLGDGVEICGRFFQAQKVWDRIEDFIPQPGQLAAIQWEGGQDTPLRELLTAEQVATLKRLRGEDN